MHRTVTAALMLLAIPALCRAQDEWAILFRASFDGRPNDGLSLAAEMAGGDAEPVWARQGTATVEGGVSGMCAEVQPSGNLTYDAPGNAYWERGTLAFWWQCVEPVGGTEFDVATIGAFNHFYYGRWYRLYCSGGRLYAYLIDWHHDFKRAPISAGEFRPQQGEWYHLAMTWDAARGIGLYVNGELMRESGVPWYMPTPLNQIGLGMSAVASHAKSGALRRQRFDEVRTYDRWLDDERIAALAAGDDVREGPPLDEEAIARHRIESLGLDRPDGLPEAPRDGRTLVVTQPRIVTAKDVLRTQLSGVDGKLDTKWPSGRRYRAEGFRYDITMAGERVNYVAMTATMRGRVQLVAGEEATVALSRGRDDPMVVRTLLDEPIAADSVHVLREISEDPSAAQHDGAMADLQLLHVAAEDITTPGDLARMGTILPGVVAAQLGQAPLDSLGHDGAVIGNEYLPLDRVRERTSRAADTLSLPRMRAVHFLSDEVSEPTGISEIELRLALEPPAGTRVRVELMHPLNYTRRQLVVDAEVGVGLEPISILLRPRDLVLEPGRRIHVVAHFTEPATMDVSASGIYCEPGAPGHTAEQARRYIDDQMRLLKRHFMLLSEARPWGWPPEKIKRLGELYACMDQLRALAPNDPRVIAYYHWTHAGEPKPLPEIAPPPEGVPEWAWYQVELLEKCRQVAHWWIDNRQLETGEFGSNDGPNDDSVLVQDWLGLYLMGEHDSKLLESARKVADMCWERTMTDGINNQVTDPLHAYEWGANVNCMMAVMDYGNPVWIERMMQMAGHYEALTGINAHGHRHYRSNRYGRSGIVTEGRYGWDTTGNALNMQAAALLAWYNGNPAARRYVTEWLDAWLEDLVDPEDGKGRACTVHFETEEKQAQRLTSYGFETLMAGAFHLTGEQRYADGLPLIWECDRRHYDRPMRSMNVAQQILRHTDREDVRENLREAIAQVELWESPIRYTDDRPELKYLEWLMTGDTEAVTEALRATLSDLTWEMPMYTTAEQSPDRLWLPQALPNMMVLGDVSMLRNRIYPLHWVSWSGTDGKLAASVFDKAPDRLRAWLVNTGDEPISPLATIWRLGHGRYEARLGTDLDEDGEFDAEPAIARAELARGSVLPVGELPPRTVMLLELTQTQALETITDRPDLAVCERDLTIDPETGAATLTMHNIGGGDAGPFTVQVAGQGLDGQAAYEVPGLAAPRGFEPSRIAIPLAGLDLAGCEAIAVAVVTDQPELGALNNKAVMLLRLEPSPPPPPGEHPVVDG